MATPRHKVDNNSKNKVKVPREYELTDRVCLMCPNRLRRFQKKFCSCKCSGSALTSGLLQRNYRTRPAGKSHPMWTGGGVKKTCVCGNTFNAKKSLTESRKFCSPACYWKSLVGCGKSDPSKKVEKLCEVCTKPFTSYISQKRRFCSGSCRGVYAASCTPNHDTSIELVIESILVELKVDFSKQHKLPGSLPDFYIPNVQLAIYADGDYWHSLPQNKARDAFVNRKLPELGYTVLRFPERLINSNPSDVSKSIGSVIDYLHTVQRVGL